MARTGLDYEAVATAAAKISERGERVTLRSVRAEIGEGSLTTIQRHLADWQGSHNRKQAAKVDAGLELPAKIVEAILAEIETAKEAVAEELRGQLADAVADREALATEVERLKDENTQAMTEYSKATGKAEILTTQLDMMTKQKNKAEQEIYTERSRAEACTARLEAAARELEALKESNKEARDESKKAREEAAELRGQLAAMKTAQVKPVEKKPTNTANK